MKTSHQKYRRSHWWKFTDWENVGIGAIIVALFGFMVFGLGWVIVHDGSGKTDSTTDSVQMDSVAVDSTLAMDSVPTKLL